MTFIWWPLNSGLPIDIRIKDVTRARLSHLRARRALNVRNASENLNARAPRATRAEREFLILNVAYQINYKNFSKNQANFSFVYAKFGVRVVNY